MAHEEVRTMGTSSVLHSSIRQAQQRTRTRLDAVKVIESPPDQPRQGYERLDTFLAETSRHLHAVDAALLPPARHEMPDGHSLVHDYLRSAKQLEVVLVHVKAHEYGSVYETPYSWADVWSELDRALADYQRHEQVLGDLLAQALDDSELERISRRLGEAERRAPSRPHPYTPHTGLPGLVARRVMGVADRFWDTVEGRMYPEPKPKPKKPPGLVAQYFLGDPRFDEEEDERRTDERR